jgi:hypothetical protein
VLLNLGDNAFEIRVAGAKAPGEPVSTSLSDTLTVHQHLKLTRFTWRSHGVNAEAVLDEGHETRDLGLVVLSRGAVHDLNLHGTLLSDLIL